MAVSTKGNKLGRKPRTPMDVLRTKLWFGWIRRQISYGSLSKTVNLLNAEIDGNSERLLYKYAKGQVSPTGLNLGYLETCYPGSQAVFENGFSNLFSILEARTLREAVRLLMDAVAFEHEAMPDQMCFGETTLDWLLNISPVLSERALREKRLLPLALVAAICEARFLDKSINLTKVSPPALEKLVQAYPGLTKENVIAAIPEVADAFEQHEAWKRIDEAMASPQPDLPTHESDHVGSMLKDFFERHGKLSHRLQFLSFVKLISTMAETPKASMFQMPSANS